MLRYHHLKIDSWSTWSTMSLLLSILLLFLLFSYSFILLLLVRGGGCHRHSCRSCLSGMFEVKPMLERIDVACWSWWSRQWKKSQERKLTCHAQWMHIIISASLDLNSEVAEGCLRVLMGQNDGPKKTENFKHAVLQFRLDPLWGEFILTHILGSGCIW